MGVQVSCPAGNLVQSEHILRSPRYVIMFRDVLAISMRNTVSGQGDDVLTATRDTVIGYQKMLKLIAELQSPVLMMSCEKCLLSPNLAVATLATFCGVALEEGDLHDIAQNTILNGDPRYSAYVERIAERQQRRADEPGHL